MFELKFETDNAAFCDQGTGEPSKAESAYETARILRVVTDQVTKGITEGDVYDINGHPVGKWYLKEGDS